MAKFVIFLDRASQYRWRLVARNGEKVAASESYPTKQNAIRSARNVKSLAASATIVDGSIPKILKKLLKK